MFFKPNEACVWAQFTSLCSYLCCSPSVHSGSNDGYRRAIINQKTLISHYITWVIHALYYNDVPKKASKIIVFFSVKYLAQQQLSSVPLIFISFCICPPTDIWPKVVAVKLIKVDLLKCICIFKACFTPGNWILHGQLMCLKSIFTDNLSLEWVANCAKSSMMSSRPVWKLLA